MFYKKESHGPFCGTVEVIQIQIQAINNPRDKVEDDNYLTSNNNANEDQQHIFKSFQKSLQNKYSSVKEN